MAKRKKKKAPPKKPAAKKKRSSSRKKGARAGDHASFFGEGLRTVASWLSALVISIASLFSWFGRRIWEGFHGQRGRQPLGMMLAAVSLFALVAMLDYEAGNPGANMCGRIGHHIADAFVRVVGVGCFLVPAFGAFWGLARLFRREGGGNAALKLTGVLVLAISVALCARGLQGDPQPTPAFPNGLGGWFGNAAYPTMAAALGSFGVVVLLVLLLGLSSLFATEWAFVPLVRELLRKSRESLRQQELPLQPERPSLREEAQRNQERAARGFRGAWGALRRLFAPYHPGGAAQPPAGASGEVGAGVGADSVGVGADGVGQVGTEGLRPASFPAMTAPGVVAQASAAAAGATSAAGDVQSGEGAAATAGGAAVGAEGRSDRAAAAASAGTSAATTPVPAAERAAATVSAGHAKAADGGASLPGISQAPEQRSHALEFEDEDPKPKRRRRKPRLDSLPPATILEAGEKVDRSSQQAEIDSLGHRLQDAFDAFGLDAEVIGAERGPTLTLFEVKLATGVSVKKLNSQRDDLGVALGSHGVRIVYPLAGRTTVGIEVPNLKRDPVRLKEVYNDADLSWDKNRLPMAIGRDTLGKPAVEDLSKMPHMLVAGTTGSGKSVCLNAILVTMLLRRTPEQVRMVLIDPKQVELQLYQDIPHLLCPVVTDMKRAPFTLDWAVRAMEERLHLFKHAGVRNITDYNGLGPKEIEARIGEEYDSEEFPDTIPFIVLVIDELADLMLVSKKEVEIAISRLAAKARAAGIHLLVATQRPSTDVVTGLIKMNLPVRMAFRVTSLVDSRVILDEGGAEDLLGNGDFLYRPPGSSALVRGQGAFVSEKEVREVCDHLRAHGQPEFLEELVQMKGPGAGGAEVDDPLYEDAVRVILQSGRGSASLIQRALSVGYTRASRLIDIMTEHGVLGPFVGSKAREVLLTVEEWEAQLDA